MAGTDGRRGTPLNAVLWSAPYRFDVRQAVRLLEMAAPDHVPIGHGSDPRREALALRNSLGSAFPPSDIETLSVRDSDRKPTLTVTMLGIGGAFGPLPPPLTARVVRHARADDHAGRDFLDLFNHRLISVLLRQSRLFHPVLQGQAADHTARLPLLALLGVATNPHDKRLHGLTTCLLGAAGLLNPRPVSAHALERLLGTYFDLPLRVLQFRGTWLRLARDQQTRLGTRTQPLGRGAVLGDRVWDQAAGIRIDVGPIGLGALRSLLPGGKLHAALIDLVRFALGDAYDVELKLSLRPDEAPPARFGSRLGWTSWLGCRKPHTPPMTRVRLRGMGAQ